MAARTPVEILWDEACCSICLEIFQDPVFIHCGHSFCRSCISLTWEGLTTNFSCPQCRETVSQKSLRPNRELANMIEAAKRLNLPRVRNMEGGENLCEEHQEPLKLFCQDDKKLICVVCDRGQREMLSHSLDISLELEQKFFDFTEKTAVFKEALEKFQDFLEFELPLTTQIMLDPETASARLYLSEDCKLVWFGSHEQDLPSNPERFKVNHCVLGSRGFTSGCHHWNVEICRDGVWAIGVAKESVPRDSVLRQQPDACVWALCHNHGRYMAHTSPAVTPLILRSGPQQIQICLDCEEGRVVFFDALSKERIFGFPPASFQGERVFTWFMVMLSAQLKLLP